MTNTDRFMFRVPYFKNNEFDGFVYFEAGYDCKKPSDHGYLGKREQCTGLRDKNGKMIYEGDFIQSKLNGLGRIAYYHAALVVAWKNEVCFYGHTTTSTPIPLDTENIEVIGNIHENPELLK